MIEHARLSVIIPGYNTPEKWWKRCVDSVRKATGPNDEIILVDDGSDDGACFLDSFENVNVVHQKNLGPNIARNTGLDVARGGWVAFVDSDDEICPDVLQHAVERLERSDDDVVLFGVETVWPDVGLYKVDVASTRQFGTLTPQTIKELAKANLLNYVWNKVYKMDFLVRNQIRFPLDTVMGEDLTFNFFCVDSGARWQVLGEVGYRYYRTHNTLLSKYKPRYVSGLRHTAAIWRKYKDSTPDGRKVLGDFGEATEAQIMCAEWKNIWMPGSPYSFIARWKWLKEHPEVGGIGVFFAQWIYVFLRQHFYFRFVRRWNIRRMYPYVKNI